MIKMGEIIVYLKYAIYAAALGLVLIVLLWFLFSVLITFLRIYVFKKEAGGMTEKEVFEFEKDRYGKH